MPKTLYTLLASIGPRMWNPSYVPVQHAHIKCSYQNISTVFQLGQIRSNIKSLMIQDRSRYQNGIRLSLPNYPSMAGHKKTITTNIFYQWITESLHDHLEAFPVWRYNEFWSCLWCCIRVGRLQLGIFSAAFLQKIITNFN